MLAGNSRRAVDRSVLLGGRRAADQGRAATLGILLLAFALAAFFAQRWLLGRKVYTSLAGKGDSGLPTQLPVGVRRLCYGVAIPWAALTLIIYSMALVGGFVETWGRDYTPTLKHYAKAFAIEWTSHGVLWAGAAWNSFWTTIKLSAIAAPLTAALGILSAYLLTRQNFKARRRSSSARCCRSRFPAR